jgi:uracil-DNA glycosylase family 4
MSAATKTKLPVFGPAHANCDVCELQDNCEAGKVVGSAQPAGRFNGIMVVGEGPGLQEVVQGKPFVGQSGQLLRALFESYNVKLDECYVTNATLCLPKRVEGGAGKSFHQRFPKAIHACLPRLEAEVAAVRPRVILAVGAAAMIAMTGYEEHYQKRQPFSCDNCDEDRKIGPVIECSAKNELKQPCKERYWADEAPEVCTACGKSLKKAKPKRVKCPVCHGLKTRMENLVRFEHDYKISEVAGAVIGPEQHAWGSLGVKYIIPTLHPSFLLRTSKDPFAGQFIAKAVQKHIRKAVHLTKNDEDWGFEYETTAGEPDSEAAEHLLDYIYGDPSVTLFAADIETEAWSADRQTELNALELTEVSDIRCIGFASRKRGYALVVDTSELAHGNPKALAKSKLYQALSKVLLDRAVTKCFHNGVYDVPVIHKLWGVRVAAYEDDTMMMHRVLSPDEPHKLAHVAFSYTYCRIWKPPKQLKGHDAHESFEDLIKYNARDVMITDEVREEMRGSLQRKKLTGVYDLDMKLQEQALTMHFNGMAVSRDSALAVGKDALSKANTALATMRHIVNDEEFNPNAPKQLTWALFSKLSFTPLDHTPTGAPSTAASSIKKLPDHPFKTALLDYSAANSVLKAYYDVNDSRTLAVPSRGLKIWADGRVHPIWKPEARSGRFTSNPNFQNIPKWFRSLIVAPPGRKIIGADYDQLELRILAALCGDEVLIDKCLNADENRKLEPDYDPHSYVAKFAFGESYTRLALKDGLHDKINTRCRCETCQRKALRDLCKRVIYGLNYGAGDEKVLESIYDGGYEGPQITLQMIGRVRNAVFSAFKRILPFQQRLIKEANANGFISDAIVGRKRFFPLGDIPVTEIKNFIIQSTGASIINIRNTLLYERICDIDPTSLYMAQVHDAVYYEVDAAKADALLPLFQECLTWETALFKGGPTMRFSAQGAIADDWKNAA